MRQGGAHTDPVDAGDIEAAKFNAHVAIAVDSNLGAWGTGSHFGSDVAGLRDHFRYDPDARFTAAKVNGGARADIYSLTEDIQWGRHAGHQPPVGAQGLGRVGVEVRRITLSTLWRHVWLPVVLK